MEHEADLLKHTIREHLPHQYLLPLERSDLLRFLKSQDDIADLVQDFAVLLFIRKTPIHPSLVEGFLGFADQILHVSELMMAAAEDLQNLVKASFKGAQAKLILDRVSGLDKEEWNADRMQRKLGQRIYELEEKLSPITISFYEKMLQILSRIADTAENAGDILREMIIKKDIGSLHNPLFDSITTMQLIIIVSVLLLGLYMAWNIGANDFANSMADAVGSKAISIRGAIILGSICELAGSTLVGAHVTDTIRKGIVDPAHFAPFPHLLILGMFCALLGTAIWLNIATWMGMPVSTTHAIVGAVAGLGLVSIGWEAVQWIKIGQIVLSWFISPTFGGVLSFSLFKLITHHILGQKNPVASAVRYAPVVVFLVIVVAVSHLFSKA